MKDEYVNPFAECAFSALKKAISNDVKKGKVILKPHSMPILGVAALVEFAGDLEGRVLLDMTRDTALFAAGKINGKKFILLDDAGKTAIEELAKNITTQAVTKLRDQGYKVNLTPPMLFVGDNMEISTDLDLGDVEAQIIPMELDSTHKIEVNIYLREKA